MIISSARLFNTWLCTIWCGAFIMQPGYPEKGMIYDRKG